MAIELIAKIAPKNDGFTGMVDADQIIAEGTIPDACIAESSVTQHEAALTISGITFTAGTNCTLTTNTLNVDDAFLKNSEADVGVGLTLTGDNSSADTAYVPMVLYGTDATPPTASNFPIGTIYIQYTP